jgi:hypothetical protein
MTERKDDLNRPESNLPEKAVFFKKDKNSL